LSGLVAAGVEHAWHILDMSSQELPSIERSRELILKAVGSSDDVAIVVRRGPGSVLATAGARALLRGTPHRELTVDQLPGARVETALLLGSGFWRLDHDVMPRALAVAELRCEQVIVLPSSFDPSDETVERALSRTRAIVFTREPDSYRRIAALCDARLAHDCAFFFDFVPYAGADAGMSEVRNGAAAASAAVLDARSDELLREAEAERDLNAWLQRIAAHEAVKTDRVGTLVAAAMLGKRVVCVAGSEFGIDSVARYALGERPVELIEHEPALPPPPAALGPEVEQALALLRGEIAPPPAPSAVRVTAVVLTQDRPGHLARALDSIERSAVPVRTLVIDNNSMPATARRVAAVCEGRERTELLRSDRNLGCAGGRRYGAELADTELVLFIDDDIELMPDALEHLLSELDRHPEADAVTGTVVNPDGIVMHSGGPVDVLDEIVTFGLLGNGASVASIDLPPSGPSGWAPGGAVLARRSLLQEHPIDATMGAYFEDNEWCYRVSKTSPGRFRRSREAIAVHHSTRTLEAAADFATRSRVVELLASYARFYELHGRLLGPWLFDHVPELRAEDGSYDLAAARLLMELVGARGGDWAFTTWMNGDLGLLLAANRRLDRLRVAEAALEGDRQETLRLTGELASMSPPAADVANTVETLKARLPLTVDLTAKMLQAEGERDQALIEREAAAERSRHLETANESLSNELSDHQDELRAALVQRDTLTRELSRARAGIERLATELDKQEEALRVSLTERTKLTDELTAKVLQAEGERDQALIEREAAADALTILQRHASELADDAGASLDRSRNLETELARIQDELGSTVAELILTQDQREQLAVALEQKQGELAEALHRALVATDRAQGVVESLRSLVGDFQPDLESDSLDEEELVKRLTMVSQDRDRVRDANAALLQELQAVNRHREELVDDLQAVNRHREELVDDLTAIWGSESWKIGRVLTWPARLVRRRPHRADNRNSENAADDERSSSDQQND
jgi:GT2 family glycosyltransferase